MQNDEMKIALAFERDMMKEINAKLNGWDGARCGGFRSGRIDREECAAVALVLVWAKGYTTDEAIRLAVKGGDIGTDAPLESDLSARRLGYRPVKPHNAIPYAEHYALPPSDPAAELPLREQAQASGSRLARLIPENSPLFEKAWTWLDAKAKGATHPDAGAACGKIGSARAREGFSNRMEVKLQRLAVKMGFTADYDTGAGRTCAKIIPARLSPGDSPAACDSDDFAHIR